MHRPAHRWRHVQINSYCSWLKADKRGFRAKRHEIHSSGDYKNPPPLEQHEGLRRYFEHLKNKEIHIERDCRAMIGRAILNELRARGIRVLAIAVAKVHAHMVPELPDDVRAIRATMGDIKRISSRAVKKWMPGKVWSRGEHAEPVNNREHLISAVDYVIYNQGSEAWTWCYRDADDDGMFARPVPEERLRRKKKRR